MRQHSKLACSCPWYVFTDQPAQMRQELGHEARHVQILDCFELGEAHPPGSDKWPKAWRQKLALLANETLGRSLWIDADVLALGDMDPALELCARSPHFVMPECWGVYPPGHPKKANRHLYSTGFYAYKPDRGRLGLVLSHNGGPWVGQQPLLSNYLETVCPTAVVKLPDIYHLNVRCEFYQRRHWDNVRPDARLLHFVGPKPWLEPEKVQELSPESWEAWQTAQS